MSEPEPPSLVPYAEHFRRYAPITGWDWRLLAAVAWEESRYNPEAISASGAAGLMQLMPTTAAAFGLTDSTAFIPEHNIRAGAEYIRRLRNVYSFITDSVQNQHFVLASYNAGPAHIMDARRLAKRYGRSPYVWFDHTEYWLLCLRDEPYASDSVVRYGAFNPDETVAYVRKVLRTYERICASEPDTTGRDLYTSPK